MKYTVFFDSILVFQDNSWLDNLNKFSENYIIESRNENKKYISNNKEFGFSNHSSFLANDENFLNSYFIMPKLQLNIFFLLLKSFLLIYI